MSPVFSEESLIILRVKNKEDGESVTVTATERWLDNEEKIESKIVVIQLKKQQQQTFKVWSSETTSFPSVHLFFIIVPDCLEKMMKMVMIAL